MKHFLIVCALFILSFADLTSLSSFEADFKQTITDEKGALLSYSGTLKASRPQSALWSYKTPVEKRVYIHNKIITIVEPELEQVIIRHVSRDFDFFALIRNAKKIDNERYLATFEESEISIELHDSKLSSLSYKDKFDNDVKILFFNQRQNRALSPELFVPSYSLDYDIITE